MPKLNERKAIEPTVPTFLNLPRSTRDELESLMGREGIRTLTDAVCFAAAVAAKTKAEARTARR
jgi:hypothetical protein